MTADHLCIIPQKKRSIIAALENSKITETGTISIPYASKNIRVQGSMFAALYSGFNRGSKKLAVFDKSGRQLSQKRPLKFESIIGKGDAAYLGGEKLAFIDLKDSALTVNEIELAEKFKSIGGMLVRNNDLFLIDNNAPSTYVLKYNISEPSAPRHIGTNKLKNNGTNEHIIKGDISENWLVLFSSTADKSGTCQHISIVGKEENWINYSILNFYAGKESLWRKWFGKGSRHDAFYKVCDICVIRNKLLILKENGLFLVDLSEKTDGQNIAQINNNENAYDRFLKINSENCIIHNEKKYELMQFSV